MAEGFIRTTLTGKEKAAILLSELDSSTTEMLYKHFSDDQIKKLRRQMKDLKKTVDWNKEVMVLEEVNEFGIRNGWLPENAVAVSRKNALAGVVGNQNKQNFNESAENIAKVISGMWLAGE